MTKEVAASATIEMHEAPEKVDPVLAEILSRPRRYNTNEEAAFMLWLAGRLGDLGYKPTSRTGGCLSVEITEANGKAATTLFTAHTDTVDAAVNDASLRKALMYDSTFGQIFVDSENKVGTCLGADDGAGVWLMLEMIKANTPGAYLFTRGEEQGGVGIRAMVGNPVDTAWLKKFEVAVALDRPRCNEVITHQRGGTRCASDKFADALALAINNQNPLFSYKKSDGGVYTDTYDLRGLIAECTNLGVGYDRQHSPKETLEYGHLCALRDALVKIKWNSLPVDREPKLEWAPSYNHQRRWDRYDADVHFQAWAQEELRGVSTAKKKAKPQPAPAKPTNVVPFREPELTLEEEVMAVGGASDWLDVCMADPDMAAEMIINMAGELAGMRAQVALYKRAIRSH